MTLASTCVSLALMGQADSVKSIRGDSSLSLIKTISGHLSPKSVVHSGNGLFLSQHMMYRHKVTIHNRKFELVKTISDKIIPSDLDLTGDSELRGAPVECAISHGGRYAWISNYNMTGDGFSKPGCDNCNGSQYDSSFVYKLDLTTFKIVNAVVVGAVPKFMAVCPDNSKLLVSNWSSGDVSIVDLKTEIEIKKIDVGTHPRGIAISPDSKTAYIAVMGSSRIVKINLEDYSKENLGRIGKGPRHICMDPTGKFIYITLNSEGKVAKYNLASGAWITTRTGRMPRSMEISENGEFLYLVNYGDNVLTKLRTDDMTVCDNIETGKKPIGVTVDASENTIWVACYSGKLMVYHDKNLNTKEYAEKGLLALGDPSTFLEVALVDETVPPVLENQPVSQKTKAPEHKSESQEPITKGDNLNSYFLIAGSFSIRKNAEREAERLALKGYETKLIISNKGLNLVTIGSSSQKSALSEIMSGYNKAENASSWIYSKRK